MASQVREKERGYVERARNEPLICHKKSGEGIIWMLFKIIPKENYTADVRCIMMKGSTLIDLFKALPVQLPRSPLLFPACQSYPVYMYTSSTAVILRTAADLLIPHLLTSIDLFTVRPYFLYNFPHLPFSLSSLVASSILLSFLRTPRTSSYFSHLGTISSINSM